MHASPPVPDPESTRPFSARAHREAIASFIRCANAAAARSWPHWEVILRFELGASEGPVELQIHGGGESGVPVCVSIDPIEPGPLEWAPFSSPDACPRASIPGPQPAGRLTQLR